ADGTDVETTDAQGPQEELEDAGDDLRLVRVGTALRVHAVRRLRARGDGHGGAPGKRKDKPGRIARVAQEGSPADPVTDPARRTTCGNGSSPPAREERRRIMRTSGRGYGQTFPFRDQPGTGGARPQKMLRSTVQATADSRM